MAAWALLGIAGIAGLFFSLYRNDVLLTAARQGGWEPRYLAAEARLLGTPGWGTPRSLSSELQAATPDPATASGAGLPTAVGDGAARPSVSASDAPASNAVAERTALPAAPEQSPSIAPVSAAAPSPAAREASAPSPATPSPARATSDGVAIVSLDALATEKKASKPAAPAAVAAPAAPARPAPVRTIERPSAAPVAKAQPAVAAKAPVAKAPPARPAPPPPPAANDSPLKAAIRSAIVKESGGK